MSESHDRRVIGRVIDPYEIMAGQIVEFQNTQYYFRPNGSVGYLHDTLENYKKKKNRRVIARSTLKGCPLFVDVEVFNMDTEDSSGDEVHIVSKETFDQILKNRRTIFTAEEIHAMLDRSSSKDGHVH
jgi:hypothetical protein